jgi:hypothetical protein
VRYLLDVLGLHVGVRITAVFVEADRLSLENAGTRPTTALVVRDGRTQLFAYPCR